MPTRKANVRALAYLHNELSICSGQLRSQVQTDIVNKGSYIYCFGGRNLGLL
jgi:hypothetical protein